MEAALSLFRYKVICLSRNPVIPFAFFSYVWMAHLDFLRVRCKQAP